MGWSALLGWGHVRLTRQGHEFEIFTGVGPLGWTRQFEWSSFSSVIERPSMFWGRQWDGDKILLEGRVSVGFGTLLSDARRRIVIDALQRELSQR